MPLFLCLLTMILFGAAQSVSAKKVGDWFYMRNGIFDGKKTGVAPRADGRPGLYYVKNGSFAAYTETRGCHLIAFVTAPFLNLIFISYLLSHLATATASISITISPLNFPTCIVLLAGGFSGKNSL